MYFRLKRYSDIILSLIALLILFPVFIIIYFLILTFYRNPVFYKQERVGQNWENFYIYKFRTMRNLTGYEGSGVTCIDDTRVTSFGAFLRKYKLDELPQLVNVLAGNMSLVGPRPELPKFVMVYRTEYDQILKMKPGISDFASIKYRNENSLIRADRDPEAFYLHNILPDKIKLNKKYLSEASIVTDFKIILSTLLSMFK